MSGKDGCNRKPHSFGSQTQLALGPRLQVPGFDGGPQQSVPSNEFAQLSLQGKQERGSSRPPAFVSSVSTKECCKRDAMTAFRSERCSSWSTRATLSSHESGGEADGEEIQEKSPWEVLPVDIVGKLLDQPKTYMPIAAMRLVNSHWCQAVNHALREFTFYAWKMKKVGMDFSSLIQRVQNRFVNLSTLDLYWSWDKLGREDWLQILCHAKWPKLTGLVLHGRLDQSEMSHLTSLSKLLKLDLSSMEIEEKGMRHLTVLSSLTYLNLKYSKIGDSSMEAVGCLQNLQTLILGKSRVSDRGLQYLSSLTKLVELNLFQTRITTTTPFSQFKNLMVLDLADTHIENNGLKGLANVVSLTNIDLTGSHVGDKGMEFLAGLTNLKRLTARGRNISGVGMETLSRLTKLEVLEIAGTKMDDIGACHMTDLKNLWKLGLCGTKVMNEGAMQLGHLSNLRYLDLRNTGIENKGLAHMAANLTKLIWLSLQFTEVNDRGMVALANMTQLRFLYLFGPLITDAGVKHLARLKDLRKLNLNNTRVSDIAVNYLLGLTNLVQLDLMCTGLSDAGARQLVALTNLSKLDLGLTSVTRTCRLYLQRELKNTRVYI
ncbi:hypothetical protein BSKO_10678 [Bryopsis sp. KO-2023]|nr:hypothetical protein BSKO_10678 [Bryopsis sp. KO-2023]